MWTRTMIGLGSAAPPTPPTPGGFEPFGLTHGAVSLAFIALMITLVWWGVRARRGAVARDGLWDGEKLTSYGRRLGWVTLGVWVVMNGYYLSPGQFAWDESLPLHVCDVVALAAPVAMLTRSRFLMALTWFWGVGLSSQGLLTPVLTVEPDSFRFYLFWANHWVAVGSGILFVVVWGLRPTWGDLMRVTAFAVVWMLGLFVVGWALGGNYGYVGRATPDAPTVLDALGPWPWRALWLSLIGWGVMVALWAPFRLGRALGMSWARLPGDASSRAGA